jgi:hypothetical protein
VFVPKGNSDDEIPDSQPATAGSSTRTSETGQPKKKSGYAKKGSIPPKHTSSDPQSKQTSASESVKKKKRPPRIEQVRPEHMQSDFAQQHVLINLRVLAEYLHCHTARMAHISSAIFEFEEAEKMPKLLAMVPALHDRITILAQQLLEHVLNKIVSWTDDNLASVQSLYDHMVSLAHSLQHNSQDHAAHLLQSLKDQVLALGHRFTEEIIAQQAKCQALPPDLKAAYVGVLMLAMTICELSSEEIRNTFNPRGQPMFIVSELDFKNYLNVSHYNKATAKMAKIKAQGDFDFLIPTKNYGILVV